jgi:hypothetical protein
MRRRRDARAAFSETRGEERSGAASQRRGGITHAKRVICRFYFHTLVLLFWNDDESIRMMMDLACTSSSESTFDNDPMTTK